MHPASLLCTWKATRGEHESVVLTWRQADRQTGRQARRAHTPYPFIPFIMIENKSPVLLLSKATQYHHAHTHTHTMREEWEREREREGGREGGKKKQKRTAATRIPAWSPTAVLTSRYRA